MADPVHISRVGTTCDKQYIVGRDPYYNGSFYRDIILRPDELSRSSVMTLLLGCSAGRAGAGPELQVYGSRVTIRDKRGPTGLHLLNKPHNSNDSPAP